MAGRGSGGQSFRGQDRGTRPGRPRAGGRARGSQVDDDAGRVLQTCPQLFLKAERSLRWSVLARA